MQVCSSIKSPTIRNGPETPTLAERFTQLIPIKYPFAALIWTLLIGPVGIRLVEYLFNESVPPFQPFVEFLGGLTIFYLFIIVRYLRLKVVAAEPQISLLMRQGEREYHSFFGWINRTGPILTLTVFLELLSFTIPNNYPSISVIGAYNFIARFIILLVFACYIWEFCVTEWGLHQLGESSVRLKSFLEDRFMGTRPIGNLALSLTLAYFVGVLLLYINFASQFGPTEVWLQGFSFPLLGIGLVMFFLPLNSIHKKMQSEILQSQKRMGQDYLAIKKFNHVSSINESPSLDKIEKDVMELVQLENLQFEERRLATTPSWPFDVKVLAKLTTIVLSVATILLSTLITSLLGI